jgi:hypothetical protein
MGNDTFKNLAKIFGNNLKKNYFKNIQKKVDEFGDFSIKSYENELKKDGIGKLIIEFYEEHLKNQKD